MQEKEEYTESCDEEVFDAQACEDDDGGRIEGRVAHALAELERARWSHLSLVESIEKISGQKEANSVAEMMLALIEKYTGPDFSDAEIHACGINSLRGPRDLKVANKERRKFGLKPLTFQQISQAEKGKRVAAKRRKTPNKFSLRKHDRESLYFSESKKGREKGNELREIVVASAMVRYGWTEAQAIEAIQTTEGLKELMEGRDLALANKVRAEYGLPPLAVTDN